MKSQSYRRRSEVWGRTWQRVGRGENDEDFLLSGHCGLCSIVFGNKVCAEEGKASQKFIYFELYFREQVADEAG
jgi:hypothetical protein